MFQTLLKNLYYCIGNETWYFLNIKKYSGNRKKLSRKKHALDIHKSEAYPPYGHAYCCMKQNDIHWMICIGGMREKWDSTYILKFAFDSNDSAIWLEKFGCIKNTKPAQIPPLVHSSLVPTTDQTKLILYGGLNLRGYQCERTIYLIELFNENASVTGIVHQDSKFNTAKKIQGEPTPRYGHSVVNVSGTLYMFGGYTIPNIHAKTHDASEMFSSEHVEPVLFTIHLNDTGVLFQSKGVYPELKRAFPCVTVIDTNMYFTGGVLPDKSREPISNLYVFNSSVGQISKFEFARQPGISATALCSDNNTLYIFGGYSGTGVGVPEISNKFYSINPITRNITCQEAPGDFRTAHCGILYLNTENSKSIVIVGGTSKSINVISTIHDLADMCQYEKCLIDQQDTNVDTWIQCDGWCKRWLHTHCIGMGDVRLPYEGEFICKRCKLRSN